MLDTVAPEAPRFDGFPDSPGRDRTPTWKFSGESGARYECRVEGEAREVIAAWAPCTSPFRADLSGRADGRYVVAVRATDAAGNVGAARRSAYELLTQAPAAPTVVGRPEPSGTDAAPSWTFIERDGLDYECRLQHDGADGSGWEPCTSPKTYDLGGRSAGEYTFSVRAVDAAGNVGAVQSESYRLAPPSGGGGPPGGGAATGPDTTAAPVASLPAVHGDDARRAGDRRSPSPQSAAELRRRADAGRPAEGTLAEATPDDDAAGHARPERERGKLPIVRNLRKAAAAVAGAVIDHPDKSVFPGALVWIVVAFLSIQNRMDRNDPKLALAPVYAEADLEFRPPPIPEVS
jgi:hypothetical protein